MNLTKKRKRTLTILGVFLGIITVAIVCFLTIHTPKTDLFNPFIPYEEDFAVVKRGTTTYNNVSFYNKHGEKSDTLSVKGNDPYRQYIAVYHKGKYIRQVSYVTLNEIPHAVREKLISTTI